MGSSRSSVSKETVARTYDQLATAYDWFLAPLGTNTRRRALNLLSIEPDDQIIEIGCGPGQALIPLARCLGPEGRLTGLDAAPGMVDRAQKRATRPATSDRIDLLLGDACSLPVATDAADVVFIEDTLELFSREERQILLKECHRVLDADGQIGVVTMEREDLEEDPIIRAYEWIFDTVPGFDRVGCRPIYARRSLEAGGFTIEHQVHHRRGDVWPVEILIGHPT